MRRLLLLSARLYPRAWRDRYGEEFAALLDDMEPPRGSDVGNVLWQGLRERSKAMNMRRWIVVGSVLSLLVVIAIVARVPATYTSKSVIRVVTNGPGAAIAPEEIIQQVAQETISRPTLIEIAKTYHLYDNEISAGRETEAIESFGKNIRVEATTMPLGECVNPPACAFARISYTGSNRFTVQKVTRDLMTRFIDTNLRRAIERNGGRDRYSTLEVFDLPSLPTEVDQRWTLQSLRFQEALVGFAIGLAFALVIKFGWSRSQTAGG